MLRPLCCPPSSFRGVIGPAIRETFKERGAAAEAPHPALLPKLRKINHHVLVCRHKTCLGQGARGATRALKRTLKERGLKERVMITKVKCLDQCGRGPVMVVYPEGVWYGGVDKAGAREIVREHLEEGRVVTKRVLRDMRDESDADERSRGKA